MNNIPVRRVSRNTGSAPSSTSTSPSAEPLRGAAQWTFDKLDGGTRQTRIRSYIRHPLSHSNNQQPQLSRELQRACEAPDLIPDDIFYINFDCTKMNLKRSPPSSTTVKSKLS